MKMAKKYLLYFLGAMVALMIVGAVSYGVKHATKNSAKEEVPAASTTTTAKPKSDKFTSFSVYTMDGKKMVIESQGRPMVVNFWATWCPPCREEMPELEKFNNRNPEVDLHLVSIQETPEEIRSFLKSKNLKLNPVIDQDGGAASLYKVTAIPTTIVVDKNGMIVKRIVGGTTASELERTLKSLK